MQGIWQTIAVTGALTDGQLRASPVDVTFPTSTVTDLGFDTMLATGVAQGLAALPGGIPVGATWFDLIVVDGTINYRGDGVAPTAAVGGGVTIGIHTNDPGVPLGIQYEVDPLSDFKFIIKSGTPRLLVIFHG